MRRHPNISTICRRLERTSPCKVAPIVSSVVRPLHMRTKSTYVRRGIVDRDPWQRRTPAPLRISTSAATDIRFGAPGGVYYTLVVAAYCPGSELVQEVCVSYHCAVVACFSSSLLSELPGYLREASCGMAQVARTREIAPQMLRR